MNRTRPPASSAVVRRFMSSLKRRHTGPEMALRVALHRRGVRYRLHPRHLPGSPDIVLTRIRLAVFVDGCFWHACPTHAVAPKSNAEFWAAKLAANVARDRRVDEALRAHGWSVLHVWEHEDPEPVATCINRLWMASATRRAPRARSRSHPPRSRRGG